MKNILIIPALEPDHSLIDYVNRLCDQKGFAVLVVDDGSSQAAKQVFEQIKLQQNATVLTHSENMGKGSALKTAIAHVRDNMPDIDGIITADADGQHSIEDICRMDKALSEHSKSLILGVRNFGEGTPARSLFGNTVSSKTLALLYGIKLKDTQTGLRAIARCHFDWLLSLRGMRYEYELNMIIYSKKAVIKIDTITIETIYFDNNSGSHFRSVRDGAKVYWQMLRGLAQYIGNSAISALVDIGLFTVLFYLTRSWLTASGATAFASAAARIVSSIVDFRLNRGTFAGRGNTTASAYFKYYTLWICQLGMSIFALNLVSSIFGVVQTVAKPFVDLILAVLSYQIQLHWVFAIKDLKPQNKERDLCVKDKKKYSSKQQMI